MRKYIIFLPDIGYYIYPYNDFFNIPNVRVVKRKFDVHGRRINKSNRLMEILECKLMKRPSNNIWYDVDFPEPYSKEDIIFIFFAAYDLYNKKNKNYIKKHYPNSKIVVMYNDLVKTHTPTEKKLLNVKNFADMIITYDKGDARKYNFQFHEDAYSKLPDAELLSDEASIDIFFSGKSKDRAVLLLDLYKGFVNHGIKSSYIIPDLNEEVCNEFPELLNQSLISYGDYLKKVFKSNCLLEISQGGTEGSYSLRVWEALTYNKKLLTNNKSIINEKFYDSRYIQVFENVEDIDYNWIKDKVKINYDYAEKLSGKAFLKFIDDFFT